MNSESEQAPNGGAAEPIDPQPTRIREQLAGKYMTFKLAEEEYAIGILKVREIIGLQSITRVPRARDYIRGVINLRGKVEPVLDLNQKFGMPATEPTDHTVIIIVQYRIEEDHCTMGLMVDEVLEVLNIPAQQLEPPPELGAGALDREFLLGVGKLDGRVVFLLDIDRILHNTECAQVSAAARATAEAKP